jgi:nitrogenase molybdenum-iron protein beta chain
MTEVNRIAKEMGINTIIFPDTSNVLNSPLTGKFKMFPEGGVTIEALKESGSSIGTIGLGQLASSAAAHTLDTKCKVPCDVLNLPIGLTDTDLFIDALRLMAGTTVPESLDIERGQLVDTISDWQQYLYKKRVAIVGDPDQLLALTRFLVDLNMEPVYIITGSPAGKKYAAELKEATSDVAGEVKIKVPGDMYLFHQWIKNEPVDLIIGNTYAKYIAKDEDIPLVRFGFPILDRPGHSYFSSVGYRGAMRLLEKILYALLDRKDRDSTDIDIELVM